MKWIFRRKKTNAVLGFFYGFRYSSIGLYATNVHFYGVLIATKNREKSMWKNVLLLSKGQVKIAYLWLKLKINNSVTMVILNVEFPNVIAMSDSILINCDFCQVKSRIG